MCAAWVSLDLNFNRKRLNINIAFYIDRYLHWSISLSSKQKLATTKETRLSVLTKKLEYTRVSLKESKRLSRDLETDYEMKEISS